MLCIKCNQNEGNKASGFCNSCENAESKRINGVLYLPAAGLLLSLLAGLFSFYGFASEVISYFMKSRMITWFALGGLVVMLVDIVFTAFTAYFFFRQKKGIRKVIIPWYLFGLVYAIYFSFLPSWLFGTYFGQGEIRLLATGIIGVVVWIPYFLYSKRISEVFSR